MTKRCNYSTCLGGLLLLLRISHIGAEVCSSMDEIDVASHTNPCRPILGPDGQFIPTRLRNFSIPLMTNTENFICTLTKRSFKIFVTDDDTGNILVADPVADLHPGYLAFSPVPSSSNPKAITFDPVSKKIYWGDGIDFKVYRSDMDGMNREDVVSSNEEAHDITLTVLSRMLYLLYKDSNRITSLSIAKNSAIPGIESNVVSEGLNRPRAMVVDEEQGYLYVSMRTEIVRIPLDGSGSIELIYENPTLFKISGLSADFSRTTRRIFFCDFDPAQGGVFYKDVLSPPANLETSYSYELIRNSGGQPRDIAFFNASVHVLWQNGSLMGIGIIRDYDLSYRSYEFQLIHQLQQPYQMHIAVIYD